MHGLFSMFNPCTTLFRVYKEHSVTTWTYTYCILEIACNKFSYKEWMCSWKKIPVVHFSSAPTSRKRPVNLHILSGCFWAVRLYYYQSYHHHQSSIIINHQSSSSSLSSSWYMVRPWKIAVNRFLQLMVF